METSSSSVLQDNTTQTRTCDVTDSTNVTSAPLPEAEVTTMMVVSGIWGSLVVIGVLGNGLVVYVMLRFGERKATNCYIVNLALSDLAFILVVVPFTMMHYVMPSWVFGVGMCKFHMYMIYVTLQSTCLTLTAMTTDRYFAIVHPIRSLGHRTPRKAVLVSGVIWMVSFMTCIPFIPFHGLVVMNYHGPRIYCRETWTETLGRAAIVAVVTVTYVIPLLTIIVCYTRIVRQLWRKAGVDHIGNQASTSVEGGQRGGARGGLKNRKLRKATKLVAVVVILFATFWLPIHVFQLWFKFDPNFPKNDVTYFYKIFAHALSYANSCVNPFVYGFLGDGFRKGMRKAFPWIFKNNQAGPLSRNKTQQGQHATSNPTAAAPPGDRSRQHSEINREPPLFAAEPSSGNQRYLSPRPACMEMSEQPREAWSSMKKMTQE